MSGFQRDPLRLPLLVGCSGEARAGGVADYLLLKVSVLVMKTL